MDGPDVIHFDGTRYLSAASAAKHFEFAPDYFTRLCREGKISARQIGRRWYVNPVAVQTFQRAQEQQRAELAQKRREEFQRVTALRSAAVRADAPASQSYAIDHTAQSSASELFSKLAAALFAITLVAGLALGSSSLAAEHSDNATSVASAPANQLASAAESVAGLLRSLAQWLAPNSPTLAYPGGFVSTPFGARPVALATAIKAFEKPNAKLFAATTTPPASTPSAETLSSVTSAAAIEPTANATSRTIIEQITKPDPLAAANFVTQDQLNQTVSNLNTSLHQYIAANSFSADASPPLGGGASNTIAAANAIDQLSGTTLNNVTVNGVSGLTAADIPTDITAANYLPLTGGALSGDLNVAGNLTAGSFSFSAASTTAFIAQNATTTNLFAANATSTDFFAANASTTNATSTDLFAVVGDFTTGVINTLSGTQLTYVAASTTNLSASGEGYFGIASTTNLTLSGSPSGYLQTNAQGVVSATSTFSANSIFGTLGIGGGGTGTSTAPNYGQLLVGSAAGGYNLVATSTLGLPTFADLSTDLGSYLSLASWYATTTNGLAEGTNNLYFTNNRVASVIAATTTDALKEGSTNLYFTTARAQNAVSVSGAPLTYTSGVIGVNQASGSQSGYLDSSDWTTFNNKVAPTSLSATYPLQYNSSTGMFSLAFGTTTSNIWAGTQTFSNLSATNATSTNFFSTNASATNATSTDLFAVVGDFTNGVINTLSGTQLTYVAASTTNLSNFGTAYFGGTATSSFNSAGQLNLAGLASAVLAVNSSGQVAATTSIGTNLLTGTLGVGNGGTGIASTPSYGNIPVGNGSTYTLTATSSLGLPTFANLASAYPFALTSNATSTLTQFNGGLTAFASSTIGNGGTAGLTVNGNATTTGNVFIQGNATTTALYATTASSTNLFSQLASLGTLNLAGLETLGSGFVSQASSTVVGNFTTTGTNALTGASNFTGLGTFANGFISQASSTIVGTLALTGTLLAQGATFTGTPLAATSGGTAQSAVTTGDLLYGSGSNAWSRLGIGTGGYVLGVVNGAPGWVATTTLATISGTLPIAELSADTVSGITLGNSLGALTFGTHLTSGGASYNGSAGVTITSDATNANIASTIVARDSSGNFSAGTITASLSGNASTVTTDANLTGPITSSGNATAIASQTGTGSTFAMSASPIFTGTVNGAGLLFNASSTIGNGTQTGGLTINGGATTTGNAYFAGNATVENILTVHQTIQGTIGDIVLAPASGGAVDIAAPSANNSLNIDDSSGNPQVGLFANGASYFTGGNVGIGTTNPGDLLSLHNSSANSSGITNTLRIDNNGSAGGDGGAIEFTNGNNSYSSARIVSELQAVSKGDLHFQIANGTLGSYADAMVINDAGNVGIGTTNLSGTVFRTHIGSNANISFYNHGGSSAIEADNDAISSFEPLYLDGSSIILDGLSSGSVGIGTTNSQSELDLGGTTGSGHFLAWGANYEMGYSSGGAVGFDFGNDYPAGYDLRTGSSAGEFINSSGNVGIGNTAPSNTLTVGSTNGQSNALISARVAGNAFEFGHTNTAGYFSTIGAEAGSGAPFIGFDTEAASTSNDYTTLGLKGTIIRGDNAGGLTIGTIPLASGSNQTPTTLMTVLSSGDVGIGTASPDNTLQVVGAIESTGGRSVPAGAGVTLSSQGSYNELQSWDGVPLALNPEGNNVAIGTTTSAQSAELSVQYNSSGEQGISVETSNSSNAGTLEDFINSSGSSVGSISFSGGQGSVAFNTTSDRRLKENIATTTAGLATLMQIPVNDFNFINDPTQTRVQGFIAQSLENIYPEAVTTNGDNGIIPLAATSTPWEVDYGRLTPLIVQAVQDIANVTSTFQQNLIAWLGSASNGIQALYAAIGNFGQVNTSELCITNGATDPAPVCLTKPQLLALLSAAGSSQTSESVSQSGTSNSSSTLPESVSSDTPPIIQINGDNPAIVQIGDTYNDLGATITGPQADLNLGIATYVNGAPMNSIQFDTSAAATDTIDYVATDQSGLTSTSTRTVLIEPAAAPSIIPTADAATSTDATTTAQ